MKQTLFIPGPLPALNDYIGKDTRFSYNADKKQWANTIHFHVRQQHLVPMQRVSLRWTWYEKDRRRDPDNFSAVGKKFILDALKSSGIIPNDGWKHMRPSWEDGWEVNKEAPGVMVEMEEA